jgi:hypothetical protein
MVDVSPTDLGRPQGRQGRREHYADERKTVRADSNVRPAPQPAARLRRVGHELASGPSKVVSNERDS